MNDPLGLFDEEDGSDPLGLFSADTGGRPPVGNIPPGSIPVPGQGQSADANTNKPDTSSFLDKAIGVGEAGLALGTGAVGFLPGIYKDILTGKDPSKGEGMSDFTYTPRTEKGEAYADKVMGVLNQLPAVAAHIPQAGSGRPKMPKLPEPVKTDKLNKLEAVKPPSASDPLGLFSDDVSVEGSNPYIPHNAEMRVDENGIPVRQALSEQVAQTGDQMDMFGDNPNAITPPPNKMPGHIEAQQLLNERQTQLEFDVKKQQTLDFNAAERQRMGINSGMARRQRGGIDFSFGDKRKNQLIEEENAASKEMFAMAKNHHEYQAWDYLSNTAGKWFDENKYLLEKVQKVRDIFPDVNMDAQLDHDASLSLARLEEGFRKLQKAIDNPEDAPLQAQNLRFILDEMDHKEILSRYLTTVQEERSKLNMRSSRDRATALEIDKALDNVASLGKGPSRSERGAIDVEALGEGFKKLMGLSKVSPEVVKAKGVYDKEKTRAILGKSFGGLDKYRPVWDSPEKVISVSDEFKDLTPTQKFIAKTVKPGMRRARASYDHPLLHYVGEKTAKVFTQAENLSRQYITGKTGIGQTFKKLSSDEKVELHQLLMKGDKEGKVFTPDELVDAGYTAKQVEFIQKYYEMETAKLDTWNEARLSTGQKPVRERPGHFAGVFSGDYRTLALDKDGRVVGFVGADSRRQMAKIQEQMKASQPGITFTKTERRSLGGAGVRSDLLSGMNDLLNVLAKNDPRIAEIQMAVEQAIANQADTLYGANKHSLEKKGIWGNEGNKPWQLDERQAANDAFKAFFRYWEDGMVSHLNMPVEAELKSVLGNPEVANKWPNAAEYVNKYINNMTGRSTSEFGMALNTLLDSPGKVLGFGASVPRETVNQINKRMGQLTQGFGNIPFTVMQFLQIAQTAMPEFANTALRVGANPVAAELGIAKSSQTMMKIAAERFSGKEANFGEMADAVSYARERGLLEFSEFEEVNKITQSKASRNFDDIVDFNRQLGEQTTRPLVFFTFVDILKNSDFPKAELFDTAYNLTQDSMVDYSARERPLMFKDMGVLGNLAGGLQQYTFSYMDQLARWTKDAAKGNVVPFGIGLTVAMTFAGISGLPFYQEADEIVRALTNRSIGDQALQNAPEWLKYGPASTYTGINLGNRLGASVGLAERFNHPAEIVSPYASSIGRMGGALAEVATEQDSLAVKNAALAFAPSSLRGVAENQLSTRDLSETEKGLYSEGTRMYQNRKGQSEYPRTVGDQEKRNFAVTSLKESKEREDVFKSSQERQRDQEGMRKITERIGRVMLQRKPEERAEWFQSPTGKRLLQEYVDKGGDVQALLQNGVPRVIVEGMQTAKQRAEGTPKTLQGVKRYEYYNR